MTRMAVRLEPLPGSDTRELLSDALDRAEAFGAPVVMAIKGGALYLHPGTPLEDAQRTYDDALEDANRREAAAKAAKPAKAAKGAASGKPAPAKAPAKAQAPKKTVP